jgi:CRISPR-associated protein Csx14
MSKKLLVAMLDKFPALVTEAIDLLTEQGNRPDGVVLIGSSDYYTRYSYELLETHLSQHEYLHWVDFAPIAGLYGDVNTQEAAMEFMRVACRILKTHRDAGHQLFVSISGGPSVMSSLLALAAQFYGAERLFHVSEPPYLEEDVSRLRLFPEDILTQKLHPPLNTENSPRLVDLPFVVPFPRQKKAGGALKSKIPFYRLLKTLLQTDDLLDFQGKPAGWDAVAILDILESVEGLPPARQDVCKIAIARGHYLLERLALELCGLFPFITRIQSGEWRSGEAKVKAEPPNRLLVFEPLGDSPLQLILETTAKTLDQLEAAKRAVEHHLEQRR